jgi:hypothetical protein
MTDKADSAVILLFTGRKVISGFDEVRCKARSTPVRITAPSQFVITPTYVVLNRCLGAGDTSLQKCVAKIREKVVVKYTNLHDYQVNMLSSVTRANTCLFVQKSPGYLAVTDEGAW